MKFLTRTIWVLSIVSLFTDIASEMLYPVVPVYLQSIGYSVFIIGIIEGVAEAMAGISKGYFGNRSDATGKRVPFVRVGYLLSALARPIMGIFANAWMILSARTMDKLGKGIRTGARDAMLSDEATAENKGKVFGFHRAMDTMGAVIGPSLALLYLYFNPGHYKELFLIAFIPGMAAFASTFFLKDKSTDRKQKQMPGLLTFVNYLKTGPKQYRQLIIPLLIFTLVNSSDVFLLLKVKEAGASDTQVIGIYIFYNLMYAVAAFPAGIIADKIGLKRMLSIGILIFGSVYFMIAFSSSYVVFILLFALYGFYAAATEGVAKALITNICSKEDSATAIGTYAAFQSICTLIASVTAGFLWYQLGSAFVFILTAVVSVGVGGWLAASRNVKIKN